MEIVFTAPSDLLILNTLLKENGKTRLSGIPLQQFLFFLVLLTL